MRPRFRSAIANRAAITTADLSWTHRVGVTDRARDRHPHLTRRTSWHRRGPLAFSAGASRRRQLVARFLRPRTCRRPSAQGEDQTQASRVPSLLGKPVQMRERECQGPAGLALRCDFSVCLGLHARASQTSRRLACAASIFPAARSSMGAGPCAPPPIPRPASTAIEILRQGGNAVDAAIATAAVLAVVEPHMTGIGGDCFALIAKPGRRKLIALNASGRAPEGRHRSLARQSEPRAHRAGQRACRDGARRHQRLDAACSRTTAACRSSACLQPAIALAQEGFVVTPRVASDWARNVAQDCAPCRRQQAPAASRPSAAGGRDRALPGAGRHAEAHRQGRPRGLLCGRVGQGHGGRAQGAGRAAHARRLRRPGRERQLRRRRSRCPIAASSWSSCRPATTASSR